VSLEVGSLSQVRRVLRRLGGRPSCFPCFRGVVHVLPGELFRQHGKFFQTFLHGGLGAILLQVLFYCCTPVGCLAEGDSAIVTDAKGQWLARCIAEDADLKLDDKAEIRGSRPEYFRPPLRLCVSHPDYATFDDWKNANSLESPSGRFKEPASSNSVEAQSQLR
jgi:hypothetical protein